MAYSTSSSHHRRFPLPRRLRAAIVRAAALAVALVLAMAFAIVLFLGWPPGDAPDLYSHVNADIYRPIRPADAGTGSATLPVREIWPAQ